MESDGLSSYQTVDIWTQLIPQVEQMDATFIWKFSLYHGRRTTAIPAEDATDDIDVSSNRSRCV